MTLADTEDGDLRVSAVFDPPLTDEYVKSGQGASAAESAFLLAFAAISGAELGELPDDAVIQSNGG